MDVGIAQFWGGIAVVVLASAVNIFITVYKTRKTSSDLRNQMDDNKDSLEKNIDANIASLEKELKTKIGVEVLSKNRQEWINDLRKKMASFILLSQNVPVKLVKASSNEQNETSKSSKDISYNLKEEFFSGINKMRKIKCYVTLLLNPNETKSNKLLELMEDIIKDMTFIWQKLIPESERSSDNVDDGKLPVEIIYNNLMHSKIPNLSNKTSCILKEEWERVKKGV